MDVSHSIISQHSCIRISLIHIAWKWCHLNAFIINEHWTYISFMAFIDRKAFINSVIIFAMHIKLPDFIWLITQIRKYKMKSKRKFYYHFDMSIIRNSLNFNAFQLEIRSINVAYLKWTRKKERQKWMNQWQKM